MTFASRAYIRTEESTEHKNCQIAYYTYSMVDSPEKIRVNINLTLNTERNEFTKSLGVDKEFTDEREAIKHAVKHAKKYIDDAIKEGRLKLAEKPKKEDKKESKGFEPQEASNSQDDEEDSSTSLS